MTANGDTNVVGLRGSNVSGLRVERVLGADISAQSEKYTMVHAQNGKLLRDSFIGMIIYILINIEALE